MRPSATARIVRTLIQEIAAHRLLPGTRLVEQNLADRFEVSRTLVRQAFFQLAQSRLIVLLPGRGACIASPSAEEARQVFAVRGMLEAEMTRAFARSASAEDLDALQQHLLREEQALQGVGKRTRLLGDFHVLMAERLGNGVLAETLESLISRCTLITLMYQSRPAATHSHEEHVEIVRALEQRDEERAVQLMQTHLQYVQTSLKPKPCPKTAEAGEVLRSALG